MSTARFGLTLGGALSDADKSVLDAVLAAAEVHTHTGGDRLADPSAPPTGVLSDTGGALAAGTTYFYRLAYVDRYGLETAASGEVSLTTTASLTAPSAPVVDTVDGGTLAQGTTYYALSALDATGNETVLSSPGLVSVADQRSVVLDALPLPAGVVSYNVWRQGPRAGGFTKIGSITDPSVAFTDTGSVADDPCACDPSNLPPQANLTNATATITLSVPTADAARLADGSMLAWRIYRATSSGGYGLTSLVQEVTTSVHADGSGGLVASWVDQGVASPVTGTPLGRSQTLTPSVLIKSGGGGGFIQNPILMPASATQAYLVDVQHGVLVTCYDVDVPYGHYGTAYPIGSGPCFLAGGALWRLTVDDRGVLSLTTTTVDEQHDQVYATGAGPRLVAAGGTAYDLSITATGAPLLTSA